MRAARARLCRQLVGRSRNHRRRSDGVQIPPLSCLDRHHSISVDRFRTRALRRPYSGRDLSRGLHPNVVALPVSCTNERFYPLCQYGTLHANKNDDKMLRFYLRHITTLLCIARLLYNYERRIRHDRPFFRLSQASVESRKFGFVSFTVG